MTTYNRTKNGEFYFQTETGAQARIIGLADPIQSNEASNKAYVDFRSTPSAPALGASGNILFDNSGTISTVPNFFLNPAGNINLSNIELTVSSLNLKNNEISVQSSPNPDEDLIISSKGESRVKINSLEIFTKEEGINTNHVLKSLGSDGFVVLEGVKPINLANLSNVPPNAIATIEHVTGSIVDAGGSNTQIQYNNNGTFGGDTGFTRTAPGVINISNTLNIGASPNQLRLENLEIRNTQSASRINFTNDITLTPNPAGYVVASNDYDMSAGPAYAFATKDYVDSTQSSIVPGGSVSSIQFSLGTTFGGDDNFTTDGSGSVSVDGDLFVDSIRLDDNIISVIGVNQDLRLSPTGTGDIIIGGATARIAPAGGNLVLGNTVGNFVISNIGYDMSSGPTNSFTTKEYVDTNFNNLKLNDISDVNVGTPGSAQNRQVLSWNNSSGTFILESALKPDISSVLEAGFAVGTQAVLSFSSTITIDSLSPNVMFLTLTGNATLAAMTNTSSRYGVKTLITHNSGGTRTLNFNVDWVELQSSMGWDTTDGLVQIITLIHTPTYRRYTVVR